MDYQIEHSFRAYHAELPEKSVRRSCGNCFFQFPAGGCSLENKGNPCPVHQTRAETRRLFELRRGMVGKAEKGHRNGEIQMA